MLSAVCGAKHPGAPVILGEGNASEDLSMTELSFNEKEPGLKRPGSFLCLTRFGDGQIVG